MSRAQERDRARNVGVAAGKDAAEWDLSNPAEPERIAFAYKAMCVDGDPAYEPPPAPDGPFFDEFDEGRLDLWDEYVDGYGSGFYDEVLDLYDYHCKGD